MLLRVAGLLLLLLLLVVVVVVVKAWSRADGSCHGRVETVAGDCQSVD